MSIDQYASSYSVQLPYDEVRMFDEPSAGEFGPVPVVFAEDPELGVRDEGSFLPHSSATRHDDEVLVAGRLGMVGSEVQVPVIATFDFSPHHGAVAALRNMLGRPVPPVAITFNRGEQQVKVTIN